MAVLIETSLGDLVIDLYTEDAPNASMNFIKLCKVKYYHHTTFHRVEKGFIAQAGDPTGTGHGGDSVFKLCGGAKFFDDEINIKQRMKRGTVAMASGGKNLNASQFFIVLGNEQSMAHLNDKHTIFGYVAEGMDVLEKIEDAYVRDEDFRPFRNIRIRHTVVLDDPFPDPDGLAVPSESPLPKLDRLDVDFVADEEDLDAAQNVSEQELKRREAQSRAEVLEVIGDLPHADVKPPEDSLFVCRLNPATRSEDLEIIFSRFGPIKSCNVVRDWKTHDSLQYAFIDFENFKDAEKAYAKMENVLIDDRRIHVDFSQSVSKLWSAWKRGDRSILRSDSESFNSSIVGGGSKRSHERDVRRREKHQHDHDGTSFKKHSPKNQSHRRTRYSYSRSPSPRHGRYRAYRRRHSRSRSRSRSHHSSRR
jgi:peptidyl-prolyl cis-trans isomerase-like 4